MLRTVSLSIVFFFGVFPTALFADLRINTTDLEGRPVRISEASEQFHVVCFLGSECPLAKLYVPSLNELSREYRDLNTRFLAVMSNDQDNLELIQSYVRATGLSIPVIKDHGQEIARAFQATRTSEVVLLSPNLEILYRGRIDDQYVPGVSRAKPDREDLRIAIEEATSGKPVSIASTEPEGCLIGWSVASPPAAEVDSAALTYTKDVVPILQKHCIECHRKGEIGPFAMSSYRKVAGWADTILETIDDGRMPPWSADPNHGEFANARHMSEIEKQILRDWVAAGKPQGNPADLPPPPVFFEGWQLGQEPDLVLPMSAIPFRVPKTGTVDYQYYVVDPEFKKDRWIRAAEVQPGDRSVVHHALVFVRPPDGQLFRGMSLLTGFVPGQRILIPPPTHARKVPAGSKLVFQLHYTPTGREAKDISRLGIVFGDEKEVTHELFALGALNHEFEIPPQTAHHEVLAATTQIPSEAELLAISPHMHYRGRSFEAFLGNQKTGKKLLSISRYDFNWQHSYVLKKPIPLKEVEELSFRAVFDNSKNNPFNPDPDQWVLWGDQTWEEMAIAFFEVAVPRNQLGTSKKKKMTREEWERQQKEKSEAYVKRCFEELDQNKDGVIKIKEVPIAARIRWFYYLDRNRDNVVTRQEIEKVYLR